MSQTQAPPTSPPRRRIPVYIQGALFLLCGLIIGSGLTVVTIRGAVQRMVAHPELLPARILQRMDSQLDLDDTQRAAIEGILQERLAAFKAIRARVQPEIQAEFDSLRNEVGEVLNPEQRELWQSRFDAIRKRWQSGG